MHLENETVKAKNTELVTAIEKVKQNPGVLRAV